MVKRTIPEREWFIQVPWGRICIVAWGDCSDPPVLLCHGSMDSAASFRPLVQLLPRKFYYIAMEFPGNGRSDPYPPGLVFSCYDLVFPLALVVQHFRWNQFILIAHSLATTIGRLYDLSYPGKMKMVINLDPIATWLTYPADLMYLWYYANYTKYYKNFASYNAPRESGRHYSLEEAIKGLTSKRGLSDEAAAARLERISEPAGDGKIRYTFDQRMKMIARPAFSPDSLEKIFTSIPTPTLSLLASKTVDSGRYEETAFKLNEAAYPHGNYRVRIIEGGHDVHFVNPERVAGYISQFMLHGLKGFDSKAKL